MKNRLISDAHRAGVSYDIEHRRTGKSTALALEAIAKALRNPNTTIRIRDHHPTTIASRHTAEICRVAVAKLGLQFFTFTEDTIRCDLYEPQTSIVPSER